MFPSHQPQEYNYRLQQAAHALNKMQIKITTAKGNPAIPIAKRKENETAFYALKEFVKISESTINGMIEGNNNVAHEQFKMGYEKGKKDGRESSAGGLPNKYFNKEAFRAWHELQIKNKWADHY